MGLLSKQANQGGRGAQNQTGRKRRNRTKQGTRARREDAKRSWTKELAATDTNTTIRPEVKLEGEC
jgi:hypothetical protein